MAEKAINGYVFEGVANPSMMGGTDEKKERVRKEYASKLGVQPGDILLTSSNTFFGQWDVYRKDAKL